MFMVMKPKITRKRKLSPEKDKTSSELQKKPVWSAGALGPVPSVPFPVHAMPEEMGVGASGEPELLGLQRRDGSMSTQRQP